MTYRAWPGVFRRHTIESRNPGPGSPAADFVSGWVRCDDCTRIEVARRVISHELKTSYQHLMWGKDAAPLLSNLSTSQRKSSPLPETFPQFPQGLSVCLNYQ